MDRRPRVERAAQVGRLAIDIGVDVGPQGGTGIGAQTVAHARVIGIESVDERQHRWRIRTRELALRAREEGDQ
jgi:hypothetical protein